MSDRIRAGTLIAITATALATAALVVYATTGSLLFSRKDRTADISAAPGAVPAATVSAPQPAAPVARDPAFELPAKAAVPTGTPSDWTTVAIDELRIRANRGELSAMEEIARRLLQGTDTPKDPQAGAGWLLRAAGLGSAQSAFNLGVMYERGFVVERDSSKAAEWYRKAADAGLPTAKHNLALLLRVGKGTPRDVKAATTLLLSAARQGMAASMFSLGDIYEQGDGGTKDTAAALAWFAVCGEYERQTNRDGDTPLSRTAAQRAQALKRTLTTMELERAQELAQIEFRQIVAALTPPPPQISSATTPPLPKTAEGSSSIDWPKNAADQVRAIQQALGDLKKLRSKPDGDLGPQTRTAIRDFQKSAGMPQTGEASREVYVALLSARHDVVTASPLPMPPSVSPPEAKAEAPKVDTTKVETAKVVAPKVEAAKAERPKTEVAKVEPAKPVVTPDPPAPAALAKPAKPAETNIDIGTPALPPPPPTSADVAALAPATAPAPASAPAKVDPPKPPALVIDTTKPAMPRIETTPASNTWPNSRSDQVKAVQTMLRDLNLYNKAIDGKASGGTQAAVRDYERMTGLKETGEVNKALFESLKGGKPMAPAAAKAN
jgi:peptidoglycan hydrolase-like protein with peptidoglycan-binding domain